jgi:hypothetical protein
MEKPTEDADDEGADSDVELVQQSSNTARRILWQRGHAATLPSTKADIIERATVSTVADAFNPLCSLDLQLLVACLKCLRPKIDVRANKGTSLTNVSGYFCCYIGDL